MTTHDGPVKGAVSLEDTLPLPPHGTAAITHWRGVNADVAVTLGIGSLPSLFLAGGGEARGLGADTCQILSERDEEIPLPRLTLLESKHRRTKL